MQNTFTDGALHGIQVSLIMVVFFLIVVFVIAHCRNLHNIAPHRATAAEALIPHQQLFKKVILKTSDAIYYFRLKNGRDYQNGWVALATYQLLSLWSCSCFKLQATSSFKLLQASSFKLQAASSFKLLQASSCFKLQATSSFKLLQASSFKLLYVSSSFKLQAASSLKLRKASSFKL